MFYRFADVLHSFDLRGNLSAGTTLLSVVTATLTLLATPGAPVAHASTTVPAPNGVAARATGAAQVTVSWSAVTGASGYRVLRSVTKGGPYNFLNSASSTSYVDASVSSGGTFYYVVQTVKKRSVSANSAEAGVTLAPVAPSAFAATLVPAGAKDEVAVSWAASAGATSYDVYRGVTGPLRTLVGTATGTSWTDASVASGTSYSYAVRAVNAGGPSADSAVRSVQTRLSSLTHLVSGKDHRPTVSP